MRSAFVLAALAACPPAAANTVFHSWMVAPPVVQAGETFTVEVWLSMEATDFDPEGTFFGWATLSVEFGGDTGLIESATRAYGHVFDVGDVSDTGIWDILPWQPGHPVNWNIDYENPIHMFSFDIQLQTNMFGAVAFEYAASSVYDAVHFGWYLNEETWHEGSVNTLETPDNYYQAEGVSVRVIPGPASCALLALAGVAVRRRR
ncbi:MAG: hypothetical protein DYG94_11650 [Leptolyngbya sp. PLA3]|nr:MAG: hypothetical protein EDM82_11790 [Cyanobacteria bacterium CYA]MCE7969379.1 hypothetical protein [Leptolyngbya sp. PL-A3]